MRTLLLVALAAMAACARPTAASNPPETTAQAPDEHDDAQKPETASPPASCDPAETARIQTSLDLAHHANTDVVAAVKTACGIRFLSSGPSKVGPKKLHRIGSVTKTYTAALVLLLAKEGALGLDDAVSRWVSGVTSVATIRQLLNHTSGIFDYSADEGFLASSPSRRWTPDELVSIAAGHPPLFAAGAGWSYSNTNYVLLGMIAEAAGRAPFRQLLRTRILDRLELSETFLDEGEASFGGLALARATDENGQDVTNQFDPSWAWAAGAIVATPTDVLTWIEALASGSFFDAGTQNAWVGMPVATDTALVSSGLGVFVWAPEMTSGGGRAIGHDGSISGFLTYAVHLPETHATIVAVIDNAAEDLTLVQDAVQKALFAP